MANRKIEKISKILFSPVRIHAKCEQIFSKIHCFPLVELPQITILPSIFIFLNFRGYLNLFSFQNGLTFVFIMLSNCTSKIRKFYKIRQNMPKLRMALFKQIHLSKEIHRWHLWKQICLKAHMCKKIP